MSRCRALIAALLAAGVTMAAAPAAHATHLEECRPYSTPTSPQDEIDAESAAIAFKLTAAEADAAAEALETPVTPGLDIPFRIAAGLAVTAEYAARTGALALYGINREADECRIDAHARLTDDLLSAQIKRDLALTSTPVALFVLPEEHGGYLDTHGVGVQVIVRDAIDRMKQEGQCTCGAAESAYGQAVTAMQGGQYKTAYRLFRQAYVYAFSN